MSADGFSVAVRGRCQIAHSFKGEQFGPAQALHGCTYVVDAVCKGAHLLPNCNYLVDICAAEAALHEALAIYNLRNLDELDEFANDNTTCERLARAVWERVAAALERTQPAVEALQIIVAESDVAHVEYERRLGPAAPPGMYTVSVRGRFMAARSLRGERFKKICAFLAGFRAIWDINPGLALAKRRIQVQRAFSRWRPE